METDSLDIKALKRIVWRSAVAGRVERFAALLNDPEKQKHFGDAFVKHLSEKIDRLFRILVILGAVYGILMLSLFAAQDAKRASEFQIFAFSFKNLGAYKEFLLLAAAFITPASSIVSAYRRYLVELRRVALRKMFPDADVLEFAAHVYVDNYFDPLLKNQNLGLRKSHGVATLLVALFGFAVIVLALTLVAASFVLQIAVIYDVANHPVATPVLNTFIVVFSLGAIALSWIVGTLQLPLPEVDLEGSMKLSQLKQQDPAKFHETMNRIVVESTRRERQWSTVFGVAIFALVYALCAALWLAPAQLGLWQVFVKSIPGLGLMAALAPSIAGGIRRAIYRAYFRKYPEGAADTQFKVFTRATRLVSACRMAAFVGGSLAYTVLTLTAT